METSLEQVGSRRNTWTGVGATGDRGEGWAGGWGREGGGGWVGDVV